MKFNIYFKFFGKKMKCNIEADNKLDAIMKLKNKIEIDRFESVMPDAHEAVGIDHLKKIFGMG